MSGPGLHFFGEEELREVIEVIKSRQISRYRQSGPGHDERSKTALFEEEFKTTIGTSYSIAMNSCTSALLAALVALDLRAGDEVLVPGYTFIATIAAIVHAGARPILVEIDDTLTMDPQDLANKITPQTRAIIPVHMLGAPCAMDEILCFAGSRGLLVIEDVAQACGGSYRGARLGSLGDAAAFSLNIFKTITSGDGGVLTTNNEKVYRAAFSFHDHGYLPLRNIVEDVDTTFGLNLRMNELVAAVALAQVRKLDAIVTTLRRQKKRLSEELLKRTPLNFRRCNDDSGDCATTISCIFRSSNLAEAVAASFGTKTAINSGKHYYGNMRQLALLGGGALCYGRGALPRTDDILSRTVNLCVGVRDSYLGTAYGIDPFSPDEEIVRVAKEFASLTRHLL